MSKTRTAIKALISKLKSIEEEVQSIRDEELEFLDNIPESPQTPYTVAAQKTIDALELTEGHILHAIDFLNEAIEG